MYIYIYICVCVYMHISEEERRERAGQEEHTDTRGYAHLMCFGIWRCVAARHSVLQCVAGYSRRRYSKKGRAIACCLVPNVHSACCSVMQCVALCCSVLHCVAMCCNGM